MKGRMSVEIKNDNFTVYFIYGESLLRVQSEVDCTLKFVLT